MYFYVLFLKYIYKLLFLENLSVLESAKVPAVSLDLEYMALNITEEQSDFTHWKIKDIFWGRVRNLPFSQLFC